MVFRLADGTYIAQYTMAYRSPRYGKQLTVRVGDKSDGATGAMDIATEAWWLHDLACKRGTWDDRTPITAWQASVVLHDVLQRDGYWFRAWTWPMATFLFGCHKARKNGWFNAR